MDLFIINKRSFRLMGKYKVLVKIWIIQLRIFIDFIIGHFQ